MTNKTLTQRRLEIVLLELGRYYVGDKRLPVNAEKLEKRIDALSPTTEKMTFHLHGQSLCVIDIPYAIPVDAPVDGDDVSPL